MTKQEEARKFLKTLEDDPTHRTRTPETTKQTRNDNLADPDKHDDRPAANPHPEDENIDAGWVKTDSGWYHPDFE